MSIKKINLHLIADYNSVVADDNPDCNWDHAAGKPFRRVHFANFGWGIVVDPVDTGYFVLFEIETAMEEGLVFACWFATATRVAWAWVDDVLGYFVAVGVMVAWVGVDGVLVHSVAADQAWVDAALAYFAAEYFVKAEKVEPDPIFVVAKAALDLSWVDGTVEVHFVAADLVVDAVDLVHFADQP